MRATLPSRFALALDGGVAHAVPGGRPLRRSLHTAPAPAGPAASATLGGVAVTSSGPIGQALLEKARRLETGRFCTGVLRVRMFEAALRMCVCVCVIFFCLCVCVSTPVPKGFQACLNSNMQGTRQDTSSVNEAGNVSEDMEMGRHIHVPAEF